MQYEGTEEALAQVLAKSMQLGKHDKGSYTITIAEHINELPKAIELSDADITQAMEQLK